MPFWRAAGFASWLEYSQHWLDEHRPGVRISYSHQVQRYVFEGDKGGTYSVPRLLFGDCQLSEDKTEHVLGVAAYMFRDVGAGHDSTHSQ